MKQQKASFINIGFSSIVMVFIMICLVTFATLSVLTAHSDYRLSQKVADKTTAYYVADAVAREAMAAIDEKLYTIYCLASTADEYYDSIESLELLKELPSGVSDITIELTDTLPFITYQVPVSDVQTLHVSLKINYPQTGSECFSTILRWQTVTVNEPADSDDYLNLYTGEE